MSDRDMDREDVLTAFAVEPAHDQSTLAKYLNSYPHLAKQLLELSLELELSEAEDDDTDFTPDAQLADAAWLTFASVRQPASEFRPLSQSSFDRILATKLSTKTSVAMALRDRKVNVSSIPLPFLKKLARYLSSTIEDVSAYLSGPSTLAAGASYKSNQKPTVGEKEDIEKVLLDCGLGPDEIFRLLAEY